MTRRLSNETILLQKAYHAELDALKERVRKCYGRLDRMYGDADQRVQQERNDHAMRAGLNAVDAAGMAFDTLIYDLEAR